jgi:DNA mismatch repair protein MutS
VIHLARRRLRELEQSARAHAEAGSQQLSLFNAGRPAAAPDTLTDLPPDPAPDPLRDYLQTLDPDAMTPREALDALYALRALGDAEPDQPS